MSDRFSDLIQKRVLVLDGATGTMLQQRGLPAGASPEAFCLEHPEVLARLQTEYIAAGADMLLAPTFGANRLKLAAYGLESRVAEINRRLVEATLQVARPQGKLVAGDVGPTGVLFAPFGQNAFETGIEIFTEQIRALNAAGVDLLLVETQLDIQEARIVLLAAREVCTLPVIVSMTFDEHGRTLTGSDPLTCLNILQSLGATAFGVNCSTGPEPMLEIVRSLRPYARIPLLVKPNAGLPVIENGRSVYPMGPEAFAAFVAPLWEAGAAAIGGCCGTTPEHIRLVAEELDGRKPQPAAFVDSSLLLSSPRRTVAVALSPATPLRLVGERINPTGKPALQAELQAGRLERIKDLAREQEAQGADLLDVNVSVPGTDEGELLSRAAGELALATELPLVLDSSSPEVLATALRYYPGRVLLNSVSGEASKLESLLPLIARYGPAFIALPLDDRGIPETLEARRSILQTILRQASSRGVPEGQAVVDGLALTVSANPEHAALALETLRYAAQTLKLPTILGLSNISFGLPNRALLNSAFLAMAVGQGLSLVIANPADVRMQETRLAADLLAGRDPHSAAFLQRLADPNRAKDPKTETERPSDALRDQILRGDRDTIAATVQRRLEQGADPLALLDGELFPAMQEVGDRYQRREYFLPQLLASAEAMERAVQVLEPHFRRENQLRRGTVVLATVKGDVHDIGKNIVGLLLRNHGFDVIDLGKSVDAETIVSEAVARQAAVIGLSALMTTTMPEMKLVLEQARQRCPNVKVVLGGAVVTAKYAAGIGADGYAADAVQAVALVDGLLHKKDAG